MSEKMTEEQVRQAAFPVPLRTRVHKLPNGNEIKLERSEGFNDVPCFRVFKPLSGDLIYFGYGPTALRAAARICTKRNKYEIEVSWTAGHL